MVTITNLARYEVSPPPTLPILPETEHIKKYNRYHPPGALSQLYTSPLTLSQHTVSLTLVPPPCISGNRANNSEVWASS